MISGKNFFAMVDLETALRATGEDVFDFLQGQFTNELRQPVGSAVYGLWLNQKGKTVADSHLLRISEKEFLIVSFTNPARIIRERLEGYLVADDVTVMEETESMRAVIVGGAEAGEALKRIFGRVPAPGAFAAAANMIVFPSRRLPGKAFEVFGAAEKIEELIQGLHRDGFSAAAPVEIEFERISAGIPSVPADIGAGDLPNEGGLDESAISYTKGCYLGQEVMARLKNLGQVRRRLHVLRGRGVAPVAFAPLFQGEKKIGEVRSVAVRGDEFVALAMLSLVNLASQAGLSLSPNGPPTLLIDTHG